MRVLYGDGTIDADDKLNWTALQAYPATLTPATFGGYDDGRLPSAKELQGLVDYTRSPDTTSSAAIDPLFPCSTITNPAGAVDYPFYRSATTHLGAGGNAGRACYVAFGRGLGQIDGSMVDIHGAGCRRSDPKQGDAADYPSAGNGPQGDVSRVFNHVRCVRGGATGPTADTDGDGLSDGYEWDYAANTTSMVATADDDGDGASNADEAAAGTIPTDAGSVFMVTDSAGGTSGSAVSWSSELGRSYALQYSANLLTDAFPRTLTAGIAATPPLHTWTLAPTNAAAYFRVVVE